jgi:hypothetical protein
LGADLVNYRAILTAVTARNYRNEKNEAKTAPFTGAKSEACATHFNYMPQDNMIFSSMSQGKN